jgi:hypothetical protein
MASESADGASQLQEFSQVWSCASYPLHP